MGSHAGKGSLAAIHTMHTVLLTAPEPTAAAALQPALAAALVAVISGADDDGMPNELILTAMAGLLGRALLCAPLLFRAALERATPVLQLAEPHVHFASAWVAMGDAIVLTAHRKLAALSLATLVGHDAALLPLLPEVLSFCVSVLADLPECVDANGGLAPSPPTPLAPAAGEHADFARRCAAANLDPLATLQLRDALQQCLRRAAEVHGEAFDRTMRELDPSLQQQVQQSFGG